MVGEIGSGCVTRARGLSGRLFGPAMALILSSVVVGCGLEMIPALPLLFPPRPVGHVPPEPVLSTAPRGSKSEPLFTASADEPGHVADQVAGSPKQHSAPRQTTRSAQPIPVAVVADEPRTYKMAPRDCNCVDLTCRQPIETCGQLWAPYYDASLRRPGLFLPEP
jgi:hypothetical protein